MTCIKCGSARIRTDTLPEYQDDGLVGLANVVVTANAAQRYVCEECGEDNGISVPDISGLDSRCSCHAGNDCSQVDRQRDTVLAYRAGNESEGTSAND